MRLIRNVVVPAKFSCQFGRHGVLKTSNTLLDKVSFEMSDVGPESMVHCRGKSMTASVSSDTSKTKKASRRVSKDVRKSMVEKYVDKYRTMNAGKFPTASGAKKNVGGSYYVVKQILQELEYNSSLTIDLQEVSRTREPEEAINSVKPSPDVTNIGFRLKADTFDTVLATKLDKDSGLLTMDVDMTSSRTESDSTISGDVKRNGVFVDKEAHKDKPLSETEEFSNNCIIVDESILKLPTEDSCSGNTQAEEGSQSLFSVESDKANDSGTQSHHLMDECKGSLHRDLESPETNLKEMTSEDFIKYDELNPDDKKPKSRILEIQERELHKVPALTAEPENKSSMWQNKSSMWQNLKSFANGILGMWRGS